MQSYDFDAMVGFSAFGDVYQNRVVDRIDSFHLISVEMLSSVFVSFFPRMVLLVKLT